MTPTLIRTIISRGLVRRSLIHRPHLLAISTPCRPTNQIRLQNSQPREIPLENLNVLQRAHKYIRDNPYTKFSLTICAIVLGLSITVELFKRFKKKKSPAVAIYPPKVGHFAIQRNDLLDEIERKIKRIKKRKTDCPVLYLTGDPGIGKSELVYQYVTRFINRSSKWFGLRSVRPIVLFVNGSSSDLLESSLKEAAFGLGVKDSDLEMTSSSSSSLGMITALSAAIRSKLLESNLPWLIVVDNLGNESIPGYRAAFLDYVDSKRGSQPARQENPEVKGQVSWGSLDGAVIVVTRDDEWKSLSKDNVISVPSRCVVDTTVCFLIISTKNLHYSEIFKKTSRFYHQFFIIIIRRLSHDQGMDLFCKLSDIHGTSEESTQLLESLHCHPLAVALAAATIKIYQSFIESSPERVNSNVISMYRDLLKQSSITGDVLNVVLSLYLEAVVTDERFRHTFDLLGSCDLTHPLPVSVIVRHLGSPFFKISKESLAPPPIDTAIQMQKLTGVNPNEKKSYFAQIKAMLPFTSGKGPSPSEIAAVLATSEDGVSYLRECPLLSFKSYRSSGFEYVQVHQSCHDQLSRLFTKYTVPKLDTDGLTSEHAQFNHSAWFRKYRSFDSQQALENFHRSLPGISERGVLTKDEFDKQSSLSTSVIETGTKSSDFNSLGYFDYQHLVSHYHRVLETLSDEVKAAGNDASDTLLRRHLYPHIKRVSRYPLLSETDSLLCSYGLVSIETALMKTNYQESFKKFESVLSKQKEILGERNQTVAHTLVDMANLKYSQSLFSEAKNLLECSLSIYEKTSTKQATKDFPLEIGLAYSSLALVSSSLGEKQRCAELLEQALGAYQTVSPDGAVSKRQRKLVSSCLTDVSHAYLALGNVAMAKKYIDLSVLAHRNLYLDGHPETIRTLNVSSIVYSLLGDKTESQKLRGEAGKLKAQSESQPLVA